MAISLSTRYTHRIGLEVSSVTKTSRQIGSRCVQYSVLLKLKRFFSGSCKQTMVGLYVLLLGIGLIGYGVYKWGTLNSDYFAKRGLKFLKPYFLFGNMGGFFLGKYSVNEFVMTLYNNFPAEK